VLDTPAAHIYEMGLEEYLDEPVWPVPSREVVYFLRSGPGGGAPSSNDGLLTLEPLESDVVDVLVHDPATPVRTPSDPFDLAPFEERCATFSTEPLEHELEVIGAPRLVLHLASDQADVDLCVRLCDVDQSGRSRLLNTGALKASHRVSHAEPQPLTPGECTELTLDVWPIAHLFKPGHRIRIDVATSDFPFFECNPLASTNELFHDAARPARLILDVPRRGEVSARTP